MTSRSAPWALVFSIAALVVATGAAVWAFWPREPKPAAGSPVTTSAASTSAPGAVPECILPWLGKELPCGHELVGGECVSRVMGAKAWCAQGHRFSSTPTGPQGSFEISQHRHLFDGPAPTQ